MRVAVLGVGLIGGSIGLASRRRLDAHVSGFDPDPATVERAVNLGVLGSGASSIAEAVEGAELIFCAAPVGALPDLLVAALDAAGDDAVVTDVGSTKRGLAEGVASHPAAGRFIGGHPIAGAETAGVDNARAELFDGARWYLTPSPGTAGLHYDRLQKAIFDIGARPQAIDAEDHDRLMATVSHLPHVIANVLVAQAASAHEEETGRLPEVGRSFRDTTRVAGANPGIWTDIFTSNSEAVAAEIERVVERLTQAAALIRSGDEDAVDEWQRGALASRRRLLEVGAGGGVLRELQVAVENKPGVVADIALALGRAGVNIEDMALAPAADMRSGAMSLWISGDKEIERARDVMLELGHSADLVSSGE